jgi:1-acyl-sn-glycerol-3-phosphate acyltransferase
MKIIYGITQRITYIVTLICMHLFCNFSIAGYKNLKGISKPLLIVANHRSRWDAMIIGTLFPFFSNKYLPLGFMAWDRLFEKPLLNFFLTANGVCRTNKGKGLDVSLKRFRSILSTDGIVAIFPYGKIILDNTARPLSGRGAATLVQDFPDLTVLPIFLNTTGNLTIWKFMLQRNKMGVFIGKPYKINDAKNKTMDELQSILVKSFHQLNTTTEQNLVVPALPF